MAITTAPTDLLIIDSYSGKTGTTLDVSAEDTGGMACSIQYRTPPAPASGYGRDIGFETRTETGLGTGVWSAWGSPQYVVFDGYDKINKMGAGTAGNIKDTLGYRTQIRARYREYYLANGTIADTYSPYSATLTIHCGVRTAPRGLKFVNGRNDAVPSAEYYAIQEYGYFLVDEVAYINNPNLFPQWNKEYAYTRFEIRRADASGGWSSWSYYMGAVTSQIADGGAGTTFASEAPGAKIQIRACGCTTYPATANLSPYSNIITLEINVPPPELRLNCRTGAERTPTTYNLRPFMLLTQYGEDTQPTKDTLIPGISLQLFNLAETDVGSVGGGFSTPFPSNSQMRTVYRSKWVINSMTTDPSESGMLTITTWLTDSANERSIQNTVNVTFNPQPMPYVQPWQVVTAQHIIGLRKAVSDLRAYYNMSTLLDPTNSVVVGINPGGGVEATNPGQWFMQQIGGILGTLFGGTIALALRGYVMWKTMVTAGKTNVLYWSLQIREIRKRVDEIREHINNWDSSNGKNDIPPIAWLDIPPGAPSAAVYNQIVDVLKTL